MIRQPLIARAIQPQTRTIDMRMPGRGRGGGSTPLSENVYLWGRRYVAIGTRARYLWIHYAANPPYAQWSSTGIDWSAPNAAMPDGVEVIDTNENALHFPFGG